MMIITSDINKQTYVPALGSLLSFYYSTRESIQKL